jgi:hypothetical protein
VPRLRLLIAAVLAAATLLLGGCVYLHLLELKLQLAHFEKNFAVDTRDGLALTFRNPMLFDEDIEQFFKWVPDSRRRLGAVEQWHFAWVKEKAAGDTDTDSVELAFDLFFTDHKLVKIVAPERFFAATMPKSLALAALRSLGHADVDREKRSASSSISSQELQAAAADRFLTEDGLLDALGPPGTRVVREETEEWHYQFAPVSPRQKVGDSSTVDVTFTLDAATRKVKLMKGRTMFGSIVFDTTHVGPNDSGNMHTALPK